MTNNHIVAKAIRVEHDSKTDKLYLVFEIINEKFRRRVQNDFNADIELEMIGLKEI